MPTQAHDPILTLADPKRSDTANTGMGMCPDCFAPKNSAQLQGAARSAGTCYWGKFLGWI